MLFYVYLEILVKIVSLLFGDKEGNAIYVQSIGDAKTLHYPLKSPSLLKQQSRMQEEQETIDPKRGH